VGVAHNVAVSITVVALVVATALLADPGAGAGAFPHGDTVSTRFPAPAGFARVDVDAASFGAFLRRLPLLPPGSPVRAYDGRVLVAPWAEAVVDLDVGRRDLQQCADSALRLYAEFRRAAGRVDDLSFHATSGDPLPWRRYAHHERPFVDGNHVRWRAARPDAAGAAPSSSSSPAFRAWLDVVFTWAGSQSLRLDTQAVRGATAPGDLFVLPGSPGHVLVVVDVARDGAGGERLLLGEGYMPAQSFHLLGWVAPAGDGAVVVASWPAPFPSTSRRRFLDVASGR
jgi:hypothetical protein